MRIASVELSNTLVSRLLAAILVLEAVVFLQVASFAQNAKGETIPGSKAFGTLPATFIGDLPCADCPGVRYQLDLFPDHAFFSRMTYQERSGTFDDIGTWEISKDGKTLRLRGSHESPEQFSIRDADTLRKLDREGREIDSKLNYDLHRSEKFSPIEPRLNLRGMYRYMADSGIFHECSTGRRWPVATEKDNATLEAAYVRARRIPGEELLVTVEGQVASRPKMEGEGTQPSLIVEKFLNVLPGETCGARSATASLENTDWMLTHLGDNPVVLPDGMRRPYIVLQSKDHRVAGFAGCNRLVGGYRLKDNSLDFGRMATTRMACDNGMDIEAAFVAAMGKVKTWKVLGQHVELYDGDRKLLARLEKNAPK